MPNPCDISVIIPCFNGAKYLPTLVESLRPLITPKVEVVLVDDGSLDGSAKLFQRLLPEAICLTQENQGLGAARNQAAKAAHGEFLQLLDVDDTIEPDKFVVQLPFARRHSLDVVYSDWRMIVVDDDTEANEPWVDAEAQVEIVEALLSGWWFPPNAPLVRAEAFRAVGGCDQTLGNTCEDFDLWVRLAIAGFRFGYTQGRFANYYRYTRVRSMSRSDPREFFEGEATIILKAIRLLKEQHADAAARRSAAASRLHAVARNVFRIDRFWHEELMNEVRRLDPSFRPSGGPAYRLVSRCLGFEAAEHLALLKNALVSSHKRHQSGALTQDE